MRVLYVSTQRSYRRGMTLAEAAKSARGSWATTLRKVMGCDIAVALHDGYPVAQWSLLGGVKSDETYRAGRYGKERPRINLLLGEPLSADPQFAEHAPRYLQRGVAVVDIP